MKASSPIRRVGLVLTLTCLLSLAAALSPAHPEPDKGRRLEYTPSWLGNTLPGSNGWVLQAVDDIFVTPDGTVYTNVRWDEHGGNVTAFKGGRFVAEARVGNHGGGFTITANADHVFFAGNRHRQGQPGIDRRDRADIFDKSKNRHVDCGVVHGLVVSADKVFASAPAENRIKVFDLNLAFVTQWSAEDPDELAADPEGNVWVIQRSLRTIGCYDAQGHRLPREIRLSAEVIPTDICFDKQGRLLVADEGVRQQIHIYKNAET